MDLDSTIAEIASHENDLQPSAQTANMAEAPQTVAPNATQEAFQLSTNDSTLSLAKTTAVLSNNDSSGNLAKVTARPSQNSLAGSRKFTPVQSIFNDFTTAHSSITSKTSKAKLSDQNTESPFQKTEPTLEHFEVKSARLDSAFPDKPPRATLKNVRNLSHEFGALGDANESEKGVFSTRSYGNVFAPRLSIVKDSPHLGVESSEGGSSSLLVHPPSTPKTRVAPRPSSSAYSVYGSSVYSPSPAPKYLSQDPESGVLPPAQAAGNDENFIPSSPIIDQSKYQPGLFHSTSETVIHHYNYGELHSLDSVNFTDDIISYYGYDEDMSFEGSNNGEDLIVFPEQPLTFENQDQTSLSNPSVISVTSSGPHSAEDTVLHHVEYAGEDDDGISMISFFDDENSLDSIVLPDNIPTATRATHGCPMVCPSQESIQPVPFTLFRRGTNSSVAPATNPSNIGLPRVPAPPGRVYLAGSSPRVLGPSSSPYGDTDKLLDLAPETPTKKSGGSQENTPSPIQKSLDGDDVNPVSPETHSRHERNISIELHGMVDDVGNSDKAPSPTKNEVGVQTTPSSFRSVMKSLRSDQKRLSKLFPDGFHGTHHSPSKKAWHRRNKAIKIPIRPIVAKDGSPRRSKHRTSGSSNVTGKEDDANDWETVTDSVLLFSKDEEKGNIRPFVDAAFYQAGSSIANYSDHLGESSSGPILAALTFAQSEHVMRYRDRYRDRLNGEYGTHSGNVIETSSSAMLPRRRQHGSDGFPLNGFRTPMKGLGAATSSLMPEETMSSPLDKYSRSRHNGPPAKPQFQAKFNDRFQQDGSISTTMDVTLTGQGGFAGPSTPNPWVEGANHLEVDFRGSPGNQGAATPDSFMQMIIQANGGKMPQYMGDNDSETRTLGSSVADTSTASGDSFVDMDGQVANANHPYGGLYAFNQDPNAKERTGITPGNSRVRAPLVKGPPEAFYRKLVSKANNIRAKMVDETPTKMMSTPSKSLGRSLSDKTRVTYSPSRMLRPLSLVVESLGPLNQLIPQPTGTENFVYKSPLAPVQSAEWMNLYSLADLNRINSSPPSSATSSPRVEQPLLGSPSWTEGPPRLTAWIHDNSSSATNTAARKEKISNITVGVCMLIPPALLLLRFGWLDQFMIWYTKGEISHFGKIQKRVAGYMFAAYVFSATVVVIITVLVHTLHAGAA
ncbi:hypothetical protein V493_04262 [Pseudogymnoascus sp. VKM F-4281 (FW-2241)]|nr:hypothetical protein V493_04262 [Pseudogymnoascus sp. VKM F-4281 (FW-2241)]